MDNKYVRFGVSVLFASTLLIVIMSVAHWIWFGNSIRTRLETTPSDVMREVQALREDLRQFRQEIQREHARDD